MKNIFASKKAIFAAGLIIGTGAAIMQKLGNPPNMGICVACFERDIAGALGLHRAAVVQYIRPEIIGLVLGAFLSAPATQIDKIVSLIPAALKELVHTTTGMQ
jgi:hypothetical protein